MHRRSIRRRVPGCLYSAAVVLLVFICASPLFAAPAKRVFTKQDMEEIRAVAIQYLQTKKPRAWQSFLVELRRDAVFLEEEYPDIGPSIGIWKIEIENDDVALVRQPPLSPDGMPGALYFGVQLGRKDGKWVAVDHFVREVRWVRE